MNKQELINYTREEIRTHQKSNSFQLGYRTAMKRVYDRAVQLDELRKPAIPKCVADMIVFRKNQGDSLVATLVNLGAFGDAQRWIRHGNNGDTFAKAWLYGYEVKKEKLYTAKLRISGEYLKYDTNFKELHHYSVRKDVANKVEAYHFTEDDLVKYYIWGNNAYEVNEVNK